MKRRKKSTRVVRTITLKQLLALSQRTRRVKRRTKRRR